MPKVVDSYRFVNGITRRVIKSWIQAESPREIPWTNLRKPINECRVTLISSGGVAMNNDRPFNQQIEKDNPWFSDPSYRIINRNVSQKDVACFHLHVDTSYFNQDFNCLLPVHRLLELEEEGFIGGTAQSHYSYIGYTLLPDPLLNGSVPLIIENLERENVDVAILIPS